MISHSPCRWCRDGLQAICGHAEVACFICGRIADNSTCDGTLRAHTIEPA